MNRGELLQIIIWYKELYRTNKKEAVKISTEAQIYTAKSLKYTLKEVNEAVINAEIITPETIKIVRYFWEKIDTYRPKDTN